MLRLILSRIALSLPVVAIVMIAVFVLARLTGDPADLLAGDMASPEVLEQIRARLGLDQPYPVQFGIWIGELAQGDMGRSILSNRPVATEIGMRLEPTLVLTFSAILLTVITAIPLGAIAAWRRDTLADRLLMTLSVLGFSVPTFVAGYVLILIASLWLGLLPVQGYVSPFEDFRRGLEHLILPTLTLSVFFMSLIARVTRSSILEVMGEDYVRTARAKGVPEVAILWRHCFRNAAVPVVTVVGLGLGMLISGVVVTESVFNIAGVGRLTIDAVLSRDFPVVQGVIIFFALTYVAINLLIDIAYVLIDPRIRY